MEKKYNLKAALVFAALLLAVQFGFAQEMKVGVVNIQKIIETTESGKKAKKAFDVENEKRSKELQKKRQDLEKMNEDLDKKKAVLSEEVFGKKQMELQEEVAKWQKAVSESNLDLQKKQKELLDPILDKLKKVINKVAEEKKMSLMLEGGPGVLYVGPGIDLTEEIIKAFEKEK